MSTKLKSSRKQAGVRRPFDTEVLKRAKKIAGSYQVIIRYEPEEECWLGRGLELPYTFNDGATPEECVKKTQESFVTMVATMLEDGETPPAPASDSVRDQQVNIRLTSEEKLRLEESAKQAGFRGVSDFMRSKALA